MTETTDDLVKRLRYGLIEYPKRWSGDTHSDMGGSVDYDKNYALLDESANRIEALEAALVATCQREAETIMRHDAKVEALGAKLAKALGLLEAWVNVAAHCTIEEGVCCCGDNMDTHSDPMECGHLPVDHGAYVVVRLVEKTLATLAEPTEGKDD